MNDGFYFCIRTTIDRIVEVPASLVSSWEEAKAMLLQNVGRVVQTQVVDIEIRNLDLKEVGNYECGTE